MKKSLFSSLFVMLIASMHTAGAFAADLVHPEGEARTRCLHRFTLSPWVPSAQRSNAWGHPRSSVRQEGGGGAGRAPLPVN